MLKQLTVFALLALLAPFLHAHETTDLAEEGLEKVRGKFSETWINPRTDFSQYDKLLFGEAQFDFRDVGPAQKYRGSLRTTSTRNEFGILPEDQEKFKQVVGEAFQKEMARSKKFEIVNEAAPGTLLVEGAVLDIVSNVPPETIGRSDIYLSTIGTATLVLEIFDATTGEMLGYVEERRKITPPGGDRIDSFSLPTNSVTVWNDVGRWASSAASRFRSALEKAQKGR